MSRAQLLAAGIPEGAIDRMVKTGRLHPLHRGVYAAGHPAVSPRGRDLAAVLACGQGALLSHQSAAALWEIRPPWRGDVHVTGRHDGERRGIVMHRARSLEDVDSTRHHGIPLTSPARTLLDLADVLAPQALERALAEAEIRRLIPPGAIPTSPGRKLLASDAAVPTRSELEDRFIAFLDANDLPTPQINQRINGLEVDFHWPDQRVIVELDGFAYHSTRRAFEVDRARDAALQAAGWRVIRITHRRLTERPGEVAAQLRRLLMPEPARAPP